MKTEILKVTPEMAEKMLENAVPNRKPNLEVVNYYADQMKRGQWVLSGEGLSFDEFNRLIDGRHRLMGVIKANRTIEFLIIYGVSQLAFDYYDSGKNRNLYDVFTIHNIPNSNHITAILQKYLAFSKRSRIYDNTSIRKQIRTSIRDYLDLYNKNPEFWNIIEHQSIKYYKKYRIISYTIIGGFMAHLILNKSKSNEFVFAFFDQLYDFIPATNNSLVKLREGLIRDALSTKRYSTSLKVIFLIKVWNAYLMNKSVKILRHHSDEEYPIIY